MLAPLLAHWRERPQRTWSVVVSVFGDAIGPRGGSVWLATLVELFAAMGVDAGAVRTAMHRLVADGWTERRRVGRNSKYALTLRGSATSLAAAEVIYAAGPPAWDGRFRLVVQPDDTEALQRAGFGQASPGLWVSAGAGAVDEAIVLHAEAGAEAARLLAARAWPLERLAAAYLRFLDAFGELPDWGGAPPAEAMVARTLLIHDYRRIVLQAPALPAEVLPAGWPGAAARELCARAYAALLPAAEAWLTEHGLPAAEAGLRGRFGGVGGALRRPSPRPSPV